MPLVQCSAFLLSCTPVELSARWDTHRDTSAPATLLPLSADDTVCLQAGDPNLKDLETAEEVPYNGTEAAAPAAAPRPAPTQTGAGAGAGTAAAPTGAPGIALVGANVTALPNGTLPTTTKAGPTTTPRPENKPKAAPVAKPAPRCD